MTEQNPGNNAKSSERLLSKQLKLAEKNFPDRSDSKEESYQDDDLDDQKDQKTTEAPIREDEGYNVCSALYRVYKEQGHILPDMKSNAITLESMTYLQEPEFFQLKGRHITQIIFPEEKLSYNSDYCYKLLQQHTAKVQEGKIFPYKQTPDRKFLDTALLALDPDDTLQLRKLKALEFNKEAIPTTKKSKKKRKPKNSGAAGFLKDISIAVRALDDLEKRLKASKDKFITSRDEAKQVIKSSKAFVDKLNKEELFIYEQSELKATILLLNHVIDEETQLVPEYRKRVLLNFADETDIMELDRALKKNYPKIPTLWKDTRKKTLASFKPNTNALSKIDFGSLFENYGVNGLTMFVELFRNQKMTEKQQKQLSIITQKCNQEEKEMKALFNELIEQVCTSIESNKQLIKEQGYDYEKLTKIIKECKEQIVFDKDVSTRRALNKALFQLRGKLGDLASKPNMKKSIGASLEDVVKVFGRLGRTTDIGYFDIKFQERAGGSRLSKQSMKGVKRNKIKEIFGKRKTMDAIDPNKFANEASYDMVLEDGQEVVESGDSTIKKSELSVIDDVDEDDEDYEPENKMISQLAQTGKDKRLKKQLKCSNTQNPRITDDGEQRQSQKTVPSQEDVRIDNE